MVAVAVAAREHLSGGRIRLTLLAVRQAPIGDAHELDVDARQVVELDVGDVERRGERRRERHGCRAPHASALLLGRYVANRMSSRVGDTVFLGRNGRAVQYVLDLALYALRAGLDESLVERKAAYAQTIVDVEVPHQILAARLHDRVEREMIGERVDVRQEVAGHLQLRRVHVVDAELERLVVEALIHVMGRVRVEHAAVHVMVHVVVRVVSARMVVVIVAVAVDHAVDARMVVLILVAEEVAQVVREAEEQLTVVVVVLGDDELLLALVDGGRRCRRRERRIDHVGRRRRLLLLLTVEYLHEEVRVAREYDLVAVYVLAFVVQLEDEIAQLAILAQRVQHLHGVREVGRVVQ